MQFLPSPRAAASHRQLAVPSRWRHSREANVQQCPGSSGKKGGLKFGRESAREIGGDPNLRFGFKNSAEPIAAAYLRAAGR
jgi:hypothetical protein